MNAREKYNKYRYVDAVKMARFAMTQLGSSDDIYQAIGQPLVSRTDSALGHYIVSSYKESTPAWKDKHAAGDIILFGVRDTQALLFPYLTKRSSRESALGFLHHERTMQHLALAALRSEESFEGLVRRVERDGHVDPHAPNLVLPAGVAAESAGCPAAAIGKDKAPTKEFVDLSLLSGEVLIEALDHNGRFSEK